MHIHHNSMSNVPAGIHSAGAAEKAAAAQRATKTRRKLIKSASQIEAQSEGSLHAGGQLLVGKWSEQDSQARERPAARHKQQGQTGEDDSGVAPISVWA